MSESPRATGSGEIDVSIDEEATDPAPPVAAKGELPPRSSTDVNGGKRARAGFGLRVPDDEITRPQSTNPLPASDAAAPTVETHVDPMERDSQVPVDLASDPLLTAVPPSGVPVPPSSGSSLGGRKRDRPKLGGPAALAAMFHDSRSEPPSKRERRPAMVAEEELPPDTKVRPAPPAPPTLVDLKSPSGEFEISVEEELPESKPPAEPVPMAAVPTPRPSSPPASLPLRVPVGMSSTPTVAAAESKPKAPPSSPSSASPIAPPAVNEAVLAARKKARPWWEEFFNEDFLRATARLTDKQLRREVNFIEESLGIEQGGSILDLACGTGRHCVELARRGYQVVGLDVSLPMLARAGEEAQSQGQKISFVQGDMREMTFDEQFDGIFSWNTGFGYFEEEKNQLVIARVHRALRTGGQFVLDVMNRDFAVRESPSLVWFEGDGCVCMDEMQMDWITSRVRVKRTMMIEDGRSKEIEYSIRLYSLHELGKLLHDHGFKVVEVSGSLATPGVFFGGDSRRTVILAEKR